MVLAWLCFWFHREEKRERKKKRRKKKEGIFKNNKQKNKPSFSLQEAQKRKKKKRKKKNEKTTYRFFPFFFSFLFLLFFWAFSWPEQGPEFASVGSARGVLRETDWEETRKGPRTGSTFVKLKDASFFGNFFFPKNFFLKSGVFHAPRSIVFLCGKTLSLVFVFPPSFWEGGKRKTRKKKESLYPCAVRKTVSPGRKNRKQRKNREEVSVSPPLRRELLLLLEDVSSPRKGFPIQDDSQKRRAFRKRGRKKRNGKRKKRRIKPLLFFFSIPALCKPPRDFRKEFPVEESFSPTENKTEKKVFPWNSFFPFFY